MADPRTRERHPARLIGYGEILPPQRGGLFGAIYAL
jgi:hypothetical protein